MNTPIKFQFWNTAANIMQSDSTGWNENMGVNEIIEAMNKYEIIPLQFTGYHDSQKAELYHKDIVEFKTEDEHDPSGYRTIRCVIEQINGCWVFCEIGFDYSKLRFPVEYSFVCEDAHEGRKIGDAFSNPELLK